MASKDLSYKINVDSSQAITGVKGFSRAVQDELKKVEQDFDDTATAGDRVATVLSAMAKDLDTELGRAGAAADALKTALGEDLGSRADVGAIITDLQRMGLSFEDIVADADKLATSLKELDSVQTKGLDAGLGNVDTKIGQIGKSADSSRSVLANMVGNATQDLGALGGLAGSAGVAIGQMGEYMVDAANSGQSLSAVVGDFAKVAGPIAILAAAVQAITGAMEANKKRAEESTQRIEDFGDAIREAADDTVGLAKAIESNLDPLRKFDAASQFIGGGFTQSINDAGKALPILGKLFVDNSVDVVDALGDMGLSIYDFTKAAEGTPKDLEAFLQLLLDMRDAGFITSEQYNAAADAVKKYHGEVVKARKEQKLFNVNQEEANALLDELIAKEAPLEQFTGKWNTLMRDMADGTIDTEAAADAVNFLAKHLGLTQEEVLGIAHAELDKQFEGAADAAEDLKTHTQETAAAWADIEAKVDEWVASVDEAKVSVGEMMDEFDASKVDTVTTALENFLAARQPGVGWLDTLGKTKEGFKELWDQIKDNKDGIPNIFRTGKERAREFRDAIDEASQSVNEQLVQALANAGGDFDKVREQANALREQMIQKIELKTGLSMDVPEERTKILGLVNAVVPTKRQVEVGIALSKEDLTKLKADLAIEQLQALLPATALQLKIDMAEGDITPAEAAATAQQIFTDNGINVDLEVNTKKADDDLVAFAAEERNAALGITVPDKSLTDANDKIRLGPGGTGWPAIEVGVKPVIVPGGYSYLTGGGAGTLAAPGPGTLAVGATAVAPTATVPGMAPLMIPVAAPQQQPIINLHSHIHTAVVGDSFDLMRAIDEGMRRSARLLPVRP
jgi:ABC-type transporter Mla subunit MlaD